MGTYNIILILNNVFCLTLGYGCLMILTSIPVYGVFIFWKNKPMIFHKIVGKKKYWNFFFVYGRARFLNSKFKKKKYVVFDGEVRIWDSNLISES